MSDLAQRIAKLSPEKRALLTKKLAQKHQTGPKDNVPRREDLGVWPLSFAQQRLWFLDQFEPDSAFYNIPAALRISGALNIGALRRGLNEVVWRHEVLRASLGTKKGRPVQIIAPELKISLPITDLRHLAEPEREAEMLRLATEEAGSPFDLSRGPLVRASLLQLGAAEHVLLLTMHHIASDGWSIGVLIKEISALYHAFCNDRPSPLLPLPIQYADYAHWQRGWLEGEVLERQLNYWKAQLGDLPPALELPFDLPRPPLQTYNGAYHTFALSPQLSDQIRELSRGQDVTLFMALLAAFQTLLYRYTGQADVSVGTPIANRTRVEMEDLIGFFVNTLVMRADLSNGPTFRQLLKRVQEVALGAYAHQDVPFEMLVDALRPERDLSRSPLFQVFFVLQGAPVGDIRLPDVTLAPVMAGSGTAKFDLTLYVEEGEGALGCSFEYNTDLFEAETVERLATHFRRLLGQLAANPDRPISELTLLTETERRLMLVEWNETRTDAPLDRCIHHMVEAQVARTPDAMALIFEKQRLTYGELDACANRLAHYLRSLGIGPERLVGICMERSAEMVVALLGILKAGGAYVPLDPAYPQERLAFMLETTRMPVLLTQTRLRDGLPTQPETRVVCLDAERATIDRQSAARPESGATNRNLAYVLFTSGSTGQPKGVAIEHRSAVALIHWAKGVYTPQDLAGVLGSTSISFDLSVYELFMTLSWGGTIILSEDALQFPSLPAADKVTLINTVPSAIAELLRSGNVPGSVRTVNLAGEPLTAQLADQIYQLPSISQVYDLYGPSEDTTYSTFAMRREGGPEIIGRPLDNTRVYLLDARLQPAPVGVPGEIYLGGDGLARGYLHRPHLTAERFIPDPFSGESGARLYRTGDLARYRPDGNLEFLGRVDHQVKIRGFRIELGEIEAVLRASTEVQETVVLAREDTPGDKRLVGYVVPADGATLTVSALRRLLKERLPEYMAPSAFVMLEAMPLTPNGKVNRRALPAPDQSRPDLEKPYVAPRTTLERLLVARWQEVLDIEKVGIHDNFFELGGDSIQAAVLVNRLQGEFNATAHVKAIFLAPTVAELAVYVQEYYPEVAAKVDGAAPPDAMKRRLLNEIGPESEIQKIGAPQVEQIRQLIPALPPRDEVTPASKNPPAVFILSPPRSGSTLLRVMLAGHPGLFAPPELDLLSFNTLAERRGAFSGEYAFWLEGVLRAVMAAKDCDLDEAEALMADYEAQNTSVKAFYRQLQTWIEGKLLVDKTPVYPLDKHILDRMEEDFEDALYVHLIRHPYATIYSFIEAKLDQLFFRHKHPFSRRELAELVWIVCHQNILAFLQDIPAERQYRLRFEDMVTQPEAVMKGLGDFLDIGYDPVLIQPYQGRRMTDGIRPNAQMVGDFKFYVRKKIDPNTAVRWKRFFAVDFMGDVGWGGAERLGYDRSSLPEPAAYIPVQLDQADEAAPRPISRDPDTVLPLSFSQRRLWFLDQLEPDSTFYNIADTVRIDGALDVEVMERCLNEIVRRHETLRTTFQTVDGKAVLSTRPELHLPLPVVTLSHLLEAEREAEFQKRATREALKPFSLARGPLVRTTLFRLSPETHVFHLAMHHIISDGWSMGVLIREIAMLYQSFAQGQPSPLPDLLIQYVDYAHWQQERLAGEIEEQLVYWKAQLAGLPPLLELPTDRPRPPVQTANGAMLWFKLSPQLSEALKELSQHQGTTLFMTLLAAFQTLLHRYTGQTDISVGSPIAGRNRPEIEGLIGFFINTLVLRADLSGAPSFRDLLDRVRETAMGAYAHQDVPFEMLVDALQPQRNLSHSPLFQTMFVLQKTALDAVNLPGMTLTPLRLDSGTAKFDLTLFMFERTSTLTGALEYNTDLFDGVTVERMLGHFKRLLESIVADPDQPITALTLLPEAERRQLLLHWNDTAADYPRDRCVHQLFEEQAARTPTATAVAYQDQELSYAELNRRANQLAHHLHKLGVGPETLVGLCVERSLEMAVGLLGVLKAGAAYLPLDPTYPRERLSFMLTDAAVPLLLTQSHLKERVGESANYASPSASLRGSGIRTPLRCASGARDTHYAPRITICLDADWAQIEVESIENPDSGVRPENLAYVIYTSGSTGVPKGAMIVHRGLVNYLTWCQRAYPLGAGTGAPVHSSISFDLTITGLFAPLMVGGRVRLLPEEVGIEVLSDALGAEQDFSLVKITPAHLELLSQQLRPEQAAGRTQAFIIGGENLVGESLDFWQTHAPDTVLVNEYGPTETVVGCCVYQMGREERRAGSVPIGRPIINTQLYILDGRLEPAPVGVVGELYIGGAGVARGYLNRPELTAERFIVDPFAPPHSPPPAGETPPEGEQGGARLYKTGDLARYRPDGNIEFLGRGDHQVKIRGFRIELDEVAAVLTQHPQVGESVAVAREGENGHKRLVGYLVPEDGVGPNVSELRDFMGEKLPEYMVPAAFVTLEALPLTPNGKVDREALPELEGERPELGAAYVAPRTPEERALADIWAGLLNVERVGVHDSFFELGGDSILSIQVIARANQTGLRLSPRQIFQYPTVAGLAAVARKGPAIKAEQGAVEGAVPLTPIQRWFLEQDQPEPHHWNQTILLDVRERLDPALLEKAVETLLAHHDALRLRLLPEAAGGEQVNAGLDDEIPFQLEDLSALPASEHKTAIETRATALQASLNLETGPLMRVAYFDLGADYSGRLLLVVHHLAIDGVSWRVLLEDLQAAYEQFRHGESAVLPPKTTSFQHWAEKLAVYAQSDEVQEELAYWLSAVDGPALTLPTDYPGSRNDEASAQRVTVGLDEGETQALLKEVPSAYGTEINEALLAALVEAFAPLIGRRALRVDLEGHGREDLFEDVDISRTVGWFTTIYPVKLDLQDVAGGPGEALKAVKEQLRRVPRRGIGYGLLRYLSQDTAATEQLESLPPAEVSFNYLGQFDQILDENSPFGPAPESVGPSRSLKGRMTHRININGSVVGGRLQMEWTYSRSFYRRETLEGVAQGFIEALQAIIAHCRAPEAVGYTPSDFPDVNLGEDEIAALMEEIGEAL